MTTHDAPQDPPDEDEGGDTACWAHLVCLECGAVEAEGHRDGCSMALAAGDEQANGP